MSKTVLLILHLVSCILLVPGLTFHILHIDITASFIVDINLFNEERSILGTLLSLWRSANYLPFLLILLFGVLIPVTKTVIIFFILLGKKLQADQVRFLKLTSKWAMADVFAVSIFIAFLGARAMRNTTATLEPGFYYFTAYVLLSAIIVGFLTKFTTAGVSSQS